MSFVYPGCDSSTHSRTFFRHTKLNKANFRCLVLMPLTGLRSIAPAEGRELPDDISLMTAHSL